MDELWLILAKDSVLARVIVTPLMIALGVFLIIVGRRNIRERVAEETGRRRSVLRLLGKDSKYTGESAANMGRVRIVMGVILIVFAAIFAVFGPILAPGSG